MQVHVNHGDYIGSYNNSHCGQNLSLNPSLVQQDEGIDLHDHEHLPADTIYNGVTLVPNPASNEVEVILTGLRGVSQVVMVDQLGRYVFSTAVDTVHSRTRVLFNQEVTDGVYWILVKHSAGVVSRKLVVIR